MASVDPTGRHGSVTARPRSRQPIPEIATCVFRGTLFDVYQWSQVQFDGTTLIFEKVRRPDTAYVIPVDVNGRLTVLTQVQPGGTPAVGLIGGRVEAGESAAEAARRELLEEAGLTAEKLILWDSFQFLPKLEWAIYIFVARGCIPSNTRTADAGERIQLLDTTLDDLIELAAQESFGDVEIALHLLRLSRTPERVLALRALLRG